MSAEISVPRGIQLGGGTFSEVERRATFYRWRPTLRLGLLQSQFCSVLFSLYFSGLLIGSDRKARAQVARHSF